MFQQHQKIKNAQLKKKFKKIKPKMMQHQS